MRVKMVGIGFNDGENIGEIFLIVPESVTIEQITQSEITGSQYDCLCECYAEQDAHTIVELWNDKFGAH